MMYRLIPVALLIAGVASAQVPGAAAKRAAQNAVNASNAQLSQQTGQAVPAPKGTAPTASKPAAPAPTATPQSAASKNAAPQTAAPQNATAQNAAPQNAQPQKDSAAPVQQSGAPAAPPAAAKVPKKDSVLVMRESFEYSRDGRRDPFVSLMTTSDLRPVLSDLRLTGVLYDLSQRRHVAIMRDESTPGGAQWRVTTGMTLGRMRVAAIRPKVVVFTIEEFGFSRQDSLILGDSTRVRSK